jgi:hypothetical protein
MKPDQSRKRCEQALYTAHQGIYAVKMIEDIELSFGLADPAHLRDQPRRVGNDRGHIDRGHFIKGIVRKFHMLGIHNPELGHMVETIAFFAHFGLFEHLG